MTTNSKSEERRGKHTLDSSDEISDKLYEDQVRSESRRFMPASIQVLSELAAGSDTPHAVKRQAANDLIAHGHVRANSDKMQLAALGGGTINVIMGNFVEAGAKPEKVIEARVINTEPVLEDDVEPAHDLDPLLTVTIESPL